MNPSRMKQFLIEERCVYARNIALPAVDQYMAYLDSLKLYRLLKKTDRNIVKVKK